MNLLEGFTLGDPNDKGLGHLDQQQATIVATGEKAGRRAQGY